MPDPHSRAETLPRLYRSVLDGVSDLERRGERTTAARLRAEALRAYAVWDESAEQRMERILDRVGRALGRPDPDPNGHEHRPTASAPSVGEPAAPG